MYLETAYLSLCLVGLGVAIETVLRAVFGISFFEILRKLMYGKDVENEKED